MKNIKLIASGKITVDEFYQLRAFRVFGSPKRYTSMSGSGYMVDGVTYPDGKRAYRVVRLIVRD